MTTTIDTREVCCAAPQLSKSSWVFAFAAPDGQTTVHKIRARDVDRLIGILNSSKAKAEHRLGLRCKSFFVTRSVTTSRTPQRSPAGQSNARAGLLKAAEPHPKASARTRTGPRY